MIIVKYVTEKNKINKNTRNKSKQFPWTRDQGPAARCCSRGGCSCIDFSLLLPSKCHWPRGEQQRGVAGALCGGCQTGAHSPQSTTTESNHRKRCSGAEAGRGVGMGLGRGRQFGWETTAARTSSCASCERQGKLNMTAFAPAQLSSAQLEPTRASRHLSLPFAHYHH